MAQDLPEVADLIGDDVTEGGFKTAIAKMLLFMQGGGGVPSGGIIMWSGSASDVPDGWALCDGNNGTPNLTDKFIVGAGSTYDTGSTGGNSTGTASVSVTVSGSTGETALNWNQMPVHNHGISQLKLYEAYSGGDSSVDTSSTNRRGTHYDTDNSGSGWGHAHSFSGSGTGSSTISTLPPYYALAFIMKI